MLCLWQHLLHVVFLTINFFNVYGESVVSQKVLFIKVWLLDAGQTVWRCLLSLQTDPSSRQDQLLGDVITLWVHAQQQLCAGLNFKSPLHETWVCVLIPSWLPDIVPWNFPISLCKKALCINAQCKYRPQCIALEEPFVIYKQNACKCIFYKASKLPPSEHSGFIKSLLKVFIFIRFLFGKIGNIVFAVWKTKSSERLSEPVRSNPGI